MARKQLTRTGPILAFSTLVMVGTASGVAAQFELSTFTVQWGGGTVNVDQSAIVTDGDVQIASQTLEFVPDVGAVGAAVAGPIESAVTGGGGGGGVTAPAPEPTPLPSATEAAQEVASSVRIGLTYNAEELAAWQDRAVNGPFRSRGDAWSNSPGDWDRLVDNAGRFLADPTSERYPGPRTDGTCVQRGDDGPPYGNVGRMRDAAFVGMVTGDDRYEAAARAELLWHARQGGLAFGDPNVWCPGVVNDINPGFEIASFVTTMLHAYDYLGPDAFTEAEGQRMDQWFGDAARYFQQEVDVELERRFDVRELDQHVVAQSVLNAPACTRISWFGGPDNCRLHRLYNNRRATMARLVGAVGVAQSDADLIRSAKLFSIEFLKYAVFADGTFAELERWRSDLPDLGWAYTSQTVGPVISIADMLARSGDTSLYDFVTSDGALGSQGGQKSILFAAQSLGRYVDGTYQRHGTDQAALVGSGTLIDGDHVNWHGVHDIVVTPANRYYDDAYLESMYERSGPGMASFPAAVASNGPNQIWSGEHGVLPAVLFMYAGLEDLAY